MKRLKPIGRCHWCLCSVCVKVGCPKYTRKFTKYYDIGFCFFMQDTGRCPTTQCDFFQHKQINRVLKVVKRVTKKDQLLAKLAALDEKLEELLEKL